MSRVVLLDAGPLGMVANPNQKSSETIRCQQWEQNLCANGVSVKVPEIAHYEVRRKLQHLKEKKLPGAEASIARLAEVVARLGLVAITSEVVLEASELWGRARSLGLPTAPDEALDGDVILCATAIVLARAGDDVEIATTNVGHLSRFANASPWDKITP